jgi:predicted PurR-regulated permease PerM
MVKLASPKPPGPSACNHEERPPFWWIRWVPTALLVFVLLYLSYIVGRVALIPVLGSFAIAYLLNPIAGQIERWGIARPVAAFLSVFLVAFGIVGFLWFVVPDLWQQSAGVGDNILRRFTERNALHVRQSVHEFSPLLDRLIGYQLYLFLRSPASLTETLQSLASGSMGNVFDTASVIVDFMLVPFFVFYILVDFPKWRDSSEDLIPPRFRDPFSRLFDEVGRILQSYVLGQLLIAILMGCMYAVGFAFLRVPAWAGIAALSGLLNVIPYVGTTLGLLIASGFTLAHDGSWYRVAGVVGVFIIVQCIEGYFLTPRILGGRLRLHPMAVFLGLLIAGKLFGFIGILVAVPATAVLQVFLKFLREIYKTSHFYHAGQATLAEAPTETPEVIAKAAESVLSEQNGEEPLELKQEELKQEELKQEEPKQEEDDRVARETIA